MSSVAVRVIVTIVLLTSSVRADEPATLPLKRVVLVNAGLAFFEHAGDVEGRRQIELPVAAEGINDLLKSLVVQDLDGGKVTAIQYRSPQPVTDALRHLTLDLSANPTVAQMLHQLRGHPAEFQLAKSPGTEAKVLKGTIVGVERRRVVTERLEAVDVDVVTLRTDSGLRAIRIEEIELTRFLDDEINRDFETALTLLSQSRQRDQKTVRLDFQGDGRRRVRFGYVQAAPVWKTSYRLVLDDIEKPFLQGWAIVENQTANDWTNVELTLLGGRPVSFEMDLYSPLYTARPQVPVDTSLPVSPRVYGQNLLPAED